MGQPPERISTLHISLGLERTRRKRDPPKILRKYFAVVLAEYEYSQFKDVPLLAHGLSVSVAHAQRHVMHIINEGRMNESVTGNS